MHYFLSFRYRIIATKKVIETHDLEMLLEARTGFEPVIKALQASALPLGHVAPTESIKKAGRALL